MKERYIEYKPKSEALTTIKVANAIIDDYAAQGLKLTLRQLFYQFVSRDLLPNTERSYKNLGNIISKGRLSGLIDWDAIEDRIRRPVQPPEFNSIREVVDVALATYRLPRRAGQETYVELWVEKDALAGVIQPIARKHHVTVMVNRGYSSQSAMHEAAERINSAILEYGASYSKILYLGDLDPSGEDMVRDVGDRLDMFGCHIDVEKIALTVEQVEEYNPPPNPAKLSDSRAKGYVAKFGDSSWEVDALPPTALRDLIEGKLVELTDEELVVSVMAQEELDKTKLTKAAAKI